MSSYCGNFFKGHGIGSVVGIPSHASVPQGTSGTFSTDAVSTMDQQNPRSVYHPDPNPISLRTGDFDPSGIDNFVDDYGGYFNYIGRYTNQPFPGEFPCVSGNNNSCDGVPGSPSGTTATPLLSNRYGDSNYQHAIHGNSAIKIGHVSTSMSMMGLVTTGQDEEFVGRCFDNDLGPPPCVGLDGGLRRNLAEYGPTAPQCQAYESPCSSFSSSSSCFGGLGSSISVGSPYSHSRSDNSQSSSSSSEPETEIGSPESTESREKTRSGQRVIADAQIYPWMRRMHSGNGK